MIRYPFPIAPPTNKSSRSVIFRAPDKSTSQKNIIVGGGVVNYDEYTLLSGGRLYIDNTETYNSYTTVKISVDDFAAYFEPLINNPYDDLTGVRTYLALNDDGQFDMILAASTEHTSNETGYTWGSDFNTSSPPVVVDPTYYVSKYFNNVLISGLEQVPYYFPTESYNRFKIAIYHDWTEFLNPFTYVEGSGYSIVFEYGYITEDYCTQYLQGLTDCMQYHGPTVVISLLDSYDNLVTLDPDGDCYYDTGGPCPPTCGAITQSSLTE